MQGKYGLTFNARAVFGVFLAVVLVATVIQLTNIRQEQNVSHQNGYKNRAVICRLTNALGLQPDAPCFDVHVTRYWDPKKREHTQSVDNTGRVLSLLCGGFSANQRPKECAHAASP